VDLRHDGSQEATTAHEVHHEKSKRGEVQHAHDGDLERVELGVEQPLAFNHPITGLVPPIARYASELVAHLF